MSVVVKGVTEKWERKLLLYNERELLKKIAKSAQVEKNVRAEAMTDTGYES
jgi:hypothetical protein